MNKKNQYKCCLFDLWLTFFFITLSIKYLSSNKNKVEKEINRCYRLFLSKVSRIAENFISSNRNLIINQGTITKRKLETITDIPLSTDSIVKAKKARIEAEKKNNEIIAAENKQQHDKALLETYTNELTEYINSLHNKCISKTDKYFASGIKKNQGALENVDNPFDNYSFRIGDYSILINQEEQT